MGNSFPAGNNPRSEFIANVGFGHVVVHFFLLSLAVKFAGNIIARSEQRECTPCAVYACKNKILFVILIKKFMIKIINKG
jgi:hypothetical protein